MLKPDNQPREVESRDPNKRIIEISANSSNIINRFNKSIQDTEKQLSNKNTSQFILKSCIVLAVSSLDYYIHEIVKYKILLIFNGLAEPTSSYNSMIVSLKCVKQGIQSPESLDWLDEEIKYRHSFKTFQRSEKIAEAIKIIDTKKIWDLVSENIGILKSDLTSRLDNIVILRDDISHQDCSQNPSLVKQEIIDNIGFIKTIGNEIHKILFPDN